MSTPDLYQQGSSHQLLALGALLQQDFHAVRVQIFQSKFTPKKKTQTES